VRLEHLGNAFVQMEHGGVRFVCDPWMTPGAWDGSWFHYPPLRKRPDDLPPIDVIYISHMHPDHFDPDTLSRFNRNAKVIINRDWGHRMEPLLKRLGFSEVHALRDRERLQLRPNLGVEMLSSFTDYCPIDSSLFIEWDGFRIMNLTENVATPKALEMLRRDFRNVDVALLPYSAAGPYPQCFSNLTEEEKRRGADRVSEERIQLFLDGVDALSPRIAVPIAGTYVLGGRHWRLSRFLGVATKERVREVFLARRAERGWSSECLLLREDTWLHVDRDSWRLEGPEDRFDPEFYARYIASLADRPYLYDTPVRIPEDRNVDLTEALHHSREKLWRYQKEYGLFFDTNLYLDAGLPELHGLNFSKPGVFRERPGNETRPYVKIQIPLPYLLMIVNNLSQWNTAEVGSHLVYHRDPEVYNPSLHMLLNFLHR